jgi:hypothetical protein
VDTVHAYLDPKTSNTKSHASSVFPKSPVPLDGDLPLTSSAFGFPPHDTARRFTVCIDLVSEEPAGRVLDEVNKMW